VKKKNTKTKYDNKTTPPKARRCVRFACSSETNNNDIKTNNGLPPAPARPAFLSEEEIKKRWYSRKDEKAFKTKAIQLFVYCTSRKLFHFDARNSNSYKCYPRGIEGYTKTRFWHRKSTIRSILVAYKRGIRTENIAIMSQKKSLWNKEIAATQASIDYIEVLQERALCALGSK